jgi:DNA-binding GntR family transcriptional regulator
MKSSGVRMPAPPIGVSDVVKRETGAASDESSPYRRIATDLRAAVTCGALVAGDALPTVATLRTRYGVSAGTANRAIAVLKAEGIVTASRGRRAVVADP